MTTGKLMAEYYAQSFYYLCEQIQQHSPSTMPFLHQIKNECGPQLGYYAAFVVVCVHLKQAGSKSRAFYELTRQELEGFTFFEVARENLSAFALFDEVVLGYKRDHANEPHLLQHPLGATYPSSSATDTSGAEIAS
jgi:hypothetical protein